MSCRAARSCWSPLPVLATDRAPLDEHDHVQCVPGWRHVGTFTQARALSPGICKTATQPQLKPGKWANTATRAAAKVSLSHGDLAEAGQHQLQFVLVLAAVRRKPHPHVTCGAIPHDSLGTLPGQALIRWWGCSFGFGGGFLAGATVTR